MQFPQIQPMRESKYPCTTQRLVACALAVGFMSGPSVHGAAPSSGSDSLVAGVAQVVDGDTIVVGETRVRLEGIDAPETSQTCQRRRLGWWACGTVATNHLASLIGDRPISCSPRGRDKYGRMLAVCFVDGRDINAAMVRQGYAWAFVKYSSTYVREEAQARAEGVGIWQGEATPPWEFRAGRWAANEGQAPSGCAIKGNVTKNGRIYHMPWSPWYAQIRIESDKGKRWFCTEAEAMAAGWRPVQAHSQAN
jgi:endonuclease YncB( thermonuclease family)